MPEPAITPCCTCRSALEGPWHARTCPLFKVDRDPASDPQVVEKPLNRLENRLGEGERLLLLPASPPGTIELANAVDVTGDHAALASRLAEVEAEREEWRGKAEHRLNEWKLRVDDVHEAAATADEAEAAKEMWRGRAETAEQSIERLREGLEAEVAAQRAKGRRWVGTYELDSLLDANPSPACGEAAKKLATIRSWCDDAPAGHEEAGGWLLAERVAELIDGPVTDQCASSDRSSTEQPANQSESSVSASSSSGSQSGAPSSLPSSPSRPCDCKAAILDSGHCDGCGKQVVDSTQQPSPDSTAIDPGGRGDDAEAKGEGQ